MRPGLLKARQTAWRQVATRPALMGQSAGQRAAQSASQIADDSAAVNACSSKNHLRERKERERLAVGAGHSRRPRVGGAAQRVRKLGAAQTKVARQETGLALVNGSNRDIGTKHEILQRQKERCVRA